MSSVSSAAERTRSQIRISSTSPLKSLSVPPEESLPTRVFTPVAGVNGSAPLPAGLPLTYSFAVVPSKVAAMWV